MTTPQAAAHRDWRAGEARRATALAELDTQLDNVRACIRWLVGQGIYVADVSVGARGRHRPRITVAPSPLLHAVFKEDCAAGQHWDPLQGRTAHDYVGIRFECEVRWSEVPQ